MNSERSARRPAPDAVTRSIAAISIGYCECTVAVWLSQRTDVCAMRALRARDQRNGCNRPPAKTSACSPLLRRGPAAASPCYCPCGAAE